MHAEELSAPESYTNLLNWLKRHHKLQYNECIMNVANEFQPLQHPA